MVDRRVRPEMFRSRYANVFDANETWNAHRRAARASCYAWDADEHVHPGAAVPGRTWPPSRARFEPIRGARVLAALGDSVTTDHISPAGSIAADSPAGKYLHGARRRSRPTSTATASRRGNDRVMTRGTFANIRIRNLLAPGTEGRRHAAPARRRS